jgi:hypothetical protein
VADSTSREPWQIEQGARCGCKGTDDMCSCQNVQPWPPENVDWQTRARIAEAENRRLSSLVADLIAERRERQ